MASDSVLTDESHVSTESNRQIKGLVDRPTTRVGTERVIQSSKDLGDLDHLGKYVWVRVFGLTVFFLLAALVAISFLSLRVFEADLATEMERKGAVLIRMLADDIARALDYGIPFDALNGVNVVLGDVLDTHPEVGYLAVVDRYGSVLYRAGALIDSLNAHFMGNAAPATEMTDPPTVEIGGYLNIGKQLISGDGVQGTLYLGLKEQLIRSQLQDIALDVLTVFFVSLLIAFELLFFVVAMSITTPIGAINGMMDQVANGDFRFVVNVRSKDEIGRLVAAANQIVYLICDHYNEVVGRSAACLKTAGRNSCAASRQLVSAIEEIQERFHFRREGRPLPVREPTLAAIRAPLFIFVFAEELSRSFFPLYVRELYVPLPYLTEEMATGLPVSVFMGLVAVGTPFSGIVTDRYGSRRIIVVGCLVAAAGFLGTALAAGIVDLLAWRGLTAIGYAMVTMACQGHIVSITSEKNRARGLAQFVGAIMVAAICGTAIGGVLADHIGYENTFFVSAAQSCLVTLLAMRILPRSDFKSSGGKNNRFGWQAAFAVLSNSRFMMIMLFSGIPAKIALTGFLFYLAPLYLHDLGNSQSMIGREMMLYFLVMIVGNPLCARLADRHGLRASLAATGGIVCALALLVILLEQNTAIVILGIVGLGIGHSLGTAPLLAMIPIVCKAEIRNLGQTTVFAIFRIVERVGSFLGPILAAALVQSYGNEGAMAGIGIVVGTASLLFVLIFGLSEISRNECARRW